MINTVKAGATPYVAPALPDLPPPITDGEEGFDSANMGPVKQLWDVTAVYGPISRSDLHKHRPMTSFNYRVYVRYHPEAKGDTSPSVLRTADQWMWDRAIDLSVEQGWLTTDADGLFTIVTIPPDHKPLTTKSAARIQIELEGDSTEKAVKILTTKLSYARMKPNTAKKNALRADLQERGQLHPIKVWKPDPMVHEHEIIVDGVTRAALLEELGIEPWKVYLPEDVTPAEVLLQRVSHELHPTTKDTSKESRDAYIAKLAELGFDHAKIAKQVGLSRKRVSNILSAMLAYEPRATPTQADIDYMMLLHEAGWKQTDIADRTQWKQRTVSKYLAIETEKDKIADATDDATPESADAASDMPKEGTDSYILLCTLMFDVPDSRGTRREVYTMAGLDPADGGGSFTTLSKRGLVQVNGKRGSSQAWEPTPKAWAFISERPSTLPEPAPLPEPKPRGRKASTPRAPRKAAPKPKSTPEPGSESDLAPVISIAPNPEDAQFNEIMAILDSNPDLMRRVIAACQKSLHAHS